MNAGRFLQIQNINMHLLMKKMYKPYCGLRAWNGLYDLTIQNPLRDFSSASMKPQRLTDDTASTLPFSSIPGPTGVAQWPVIGFLKLFKPFTKFTSARADLLFDDLFQKYGPIVRIQLKGPTVIIRDIKDIEVVFRNEGIYPWRPSSGLHVQFAKRNKLKGGLSEMQGKKWQELRSPLSKRLARVNSATYYMHDQNAVADDFRDALSSADTMTPEDLSETFFKFAAESIGVVCFNTRLGFLDRNISKNPDAVEYLLATKAVFQALQEEISGRSILHGVYRNKTYRDYESAQLKLRHHSGRELVKAKNVLKQKQEKGTFDPDEPNLLFSLLSDPNIDFDDIRTLMNTLYAAGTDSTAKNLQLLFYNLARNPEKQEILHKQIIDVLGPDQPLTPEALTKMPYLKAAVKESFRLFIPTLGLCRILPKDVIFSGYRVPAGTRVLVCSSNVSKAYFDNPHLYIPERWLRSDEGTRSGSYIHPMAVLPFGYGPRNCIGRRFAEQEIYLASVKVLQKMKIGVKQESEVVQLAYSVFLGPEKPIAFTFSKRS